MTDTEFTEIMNALAAEFETLGQKLEKRGLLLKEWRLALGQLEKALVNRAMRRWVRKHNNEPTLDRFMQVVEEIQEEMRVSYRPKAKPENVAGPIFKAVEHAAQQQRTPDDKLWASLHLQLMRRIMGKTSAERDQIMLEYYEKWARDYPQFERDCRVAAASVGVDHDSPVPF